MALPPEKFRECVFLLLFSLTHHEENHEKELMELVMDELKVSRSAVREAFVQSQLIVKDLSVIDSIISEVAVSFSPERILGAEKTVLRLIFWELFVQKKAPPKVLVSEAKRLIKKFAQDDAVTFIHALVLNACSKQGVSLDKV